MTGSADSRPLDGALRARLHLADSSRAKLEALRMSMHALDATSRFCLGKAFFSLRESEALLEELDDVTGLNLVQAILKRHGGTKIQTEGIGHIPWSGPVVIASTHPTGMFDFVAHAGALIERRPDLKVVANEETRMFLGSECIIPVSIDRENNATSTRKTQAQMVRHLKVGGALLIFGSGRVPHMRHGQLVEPDWRSGPSRISAQCQVPIVPAAINATNSRYYYRLRSIAQFLKGGDDNFGAMVGSLRYASEVLEKLGTAVEVRYGASLPPGTTPARIKAQAEGLFPGLYGAE